MRGGGWDIVTQHLEGEFYKADPVGPGQPHDGRKIFNHFTNTVQINPYAVQRATNNKVSAQALWSRSVLPDPQSELARQGLCASNAICTLA